MQQLQRHSQKLLKPDKSIFREKRDSIKKNFSTPLNEVKNATLT